jgi:predicted hotdog family 3-hydroxylacyl-ACP dehydratase
MSPLPQIEQLVPHRPPSLLLDDVVEAGEDYISCHATIRASSPFVRDGGVDGVVLLEVMAQAVAAYAGLVARRDGVEPRVGFLVGCRDAVLSCERVAVGTDLLVEARREWGQQEVGSFRCRVVLDGVVLAEASLNVAYAERPG